MAAAIAWQVANHIKAMPSNPQAIDALLPSIPDTTIVSNAIIQSSRLRCPTHPEVESSTSETISKASSHPEVDSDPPLNPKCMTTSNWVGS